jgi:hypothetical protein
VATSNINDVVRALYVDAALVHGSRT